MGSTLHRQQKDAILKDLEKKIVLLAGPRQAGKTWLAKQISEMFTHSLYLSYDEQEHRKIIQEKSWLSSVELLILDELHKMPEWKNYLKGLSDTRPPTMKILVTGSARLETFNQVGDSLAGRFFLHRLLPLSPAELHQTQQPYSLDHLLERGGFPEPYLAESNTEANRWRLQYVDSLLRTDVLDFENIQYLRAIQNVFELLRTKVGSPISYTSIAEDLAISPTTVKKYIAILEALFIVFRITPFSKNIARSLLKEPKIYFFDIGLVQGDHGTKFENFMAQCLLKHVYGKTDYEGTPYALHYIRTKERLEIDFAITHNNDIEMLVEAKYKSQQLNKSHLYFKDKYNLPYCQVVKDMAHSYHKQGVSLLCADAFLKELYL